MKRLLLLSLSSQYAHLSLAPWCLRAGLLAYGPPAHLTIVEGTVNQSDAQILGLLDGHPCDLLGLSCAICDRDAVIAAAGGAKKDVLEQSISADLEQIMEQRVTYERGVGETQEVALSGRDAYTVITAAPVITDGDVTGCVVFLSEDENAAANEVTVKLCQTAAQFLSRRMAV